MRSDLTFGRSAPQGNRLAGNGRQNPYARADPAAPRTSFFGKPAPRVRLAFRDGTAYGPAGARGKQWTQGARG
jgi:hypothetical protein